MVYLAEAHAADTWPLSENEICAQHNFVEQRLCAAKRLLDQYPDLTDLLEGRLYVDNIDNQTTLAHGLWPERYLLLDGDKVQWASTLSFENRLVDINSQLLLAARQVWC